MPRIPMPLTVHIVVPRCDMEVQAVPLDTRSMVVQV